MQLTRTQARILRRAPLAAALVLATLAEAHAGQPARPPFSVAAPAAWVPGDGRGVAAFMQALAAVGTRPASGTPAGSRAVTSCADDGGPGTLRAVVAHANSGDTIDLRALACSTITLAQGAIAVDLDELTLVGPGAEALAIDGAASDRLFLHYGYATLTLRGLTVRNGLNRVSGYQVAGGACIASNGYVTLDHAAVSDCVANGEGAYGGGILAHGVTLYTSILSGNTAQGTLLNTLTAAYGGGAFAYRGTAALYDSTVRGNRAAPDPASTHGSYDTGGGIFADNGGVAYRSTVEGNYCSGTGGGIASHAGISIVDSTISGNRAKAKTGGGLFVRTSGSISISNSTIAQNIAFSGGGIYVAGAPTSFTPESTIVADNGAVAGGGDLASQTPLVVVGANDLVVAVGANVALPPDTLRADPRLLPLADNGGPTRTHALAAGSPALDAGNNVANLATDQRGPGFPRVVGVAADIGSFESAAVAATTQSVPALSTWAATLLAGLLVGLGMRRRRPSGHPG